MAFGFGRKDRGDKTPKDASYGGARISQGGAAPSDVTSPEGQFWLAGRLADASARIGFPLSVVDGALTTPAGVKLGTHNLAAMLAAAPREAWEAIIENHARIMSTPGPDIPTSLEAAREHLLPRPWVAVEEGDLPVPEWATPFGGGIGIGVVLDYPDRVVTPTERHQINGMGGWDAVYPVALANLRGMERPEHAVNLASDDESSRFHVFVTDDFHCPARVLLLDELLAEVGDPVGENGVLFAFPHRHLMLAHVPTSMAAMSALMVMGPSVEKQFRSGPGPLSPWVYYRGPDGAAQQVTIPAEKPGAVGIDGTGAFYALLEKLTA